MLEVIALALAVGALIGLRKLGDRVNALESELALLRRAVVAGEGEAALAGIPEVGEPPMSRPAARVILAPPEAAEPAPEPISVDAVPQPVMAEATPAAIDLPGRPPEPPAEPAVPRRSASQLFEQYVGGKLPIWVGGAALAIAGYYLVRYAIEMGLLTPGVRVFLAMAFGLVLLAAGELSARIPRLGDDPRVAQALSGAGIATLYAAAYLASGVYGLITPLAAFILMAGVTGLALFLSLRRGPPTAIMGLIGGFATPVLAGGDSETVWPVLIYLTLLSGGLFALAIGRGWFWLSLASAAGSLFWGLALIAWLGDGQPAAIGAFVVLIAFAAALVAPATDRVRRLPWLRGLPVAVGLVEIAFLIPRSGFGLEGWGLYLLLSGGSIWLAMREARLVLFTAGALMVALVALAATLFGTAETGICLFASIGVGLLFGGAGHVFARREDAGIWWTGIAAAGLIGPFVMIRFIRPDLMTDAGWGLAALGLALPPLHLALRSRAFAREAGWPDWPLLIGAATAALFAGLAAIDLVPERLLTATLLVIGIALAGAGRRIGDAGLYRLSIGAAGAAALAWVVRLTPIEDFGRLFGALPPVSVAESALALLLPGLLLGGLAWLHRDRLTTMPLRLIAALLGVAAVMAVMPPEWRPLTMAALTLAVAEGARLGELPRPAALAAQIGALLWLLWGGRMLLWALGYSLAGEHVLLPLLPEPLDALRALILPAPLLALSTWRAPPVLPGHRAGVRAGAAAALAGGVYVFLKQPIAIRTEAEFVALGFVERAALTQALLWAAAGVALRWRESEAAARLVAGLAVVALFRVLWFDLLLLNPAWVAQWVAPLPIVNLLTLHFGLLGLWLAGAWMRAQGMARAGLLAAIVLLLGGGLGLVTRQLFHGAILTGDLGKGEFYAYSVAGTLFAAALLFSGVRAGDRLMRLAGLALVTLLVLKVFLVDAAALEGLLRIASFLGLGFALIGIGWAYGRFLGGNSAERLAQA
jgi:uncharacterized membrane protein